MAVKRPSGRVQDARANIAVVAMRMFTEHGFAATTMADVAAAAGVSRRTLFRLFPTKTALSTALHESLYDELYTTLAAEGAAGGAAALMMTSILAWMRRFPAESAREFSDLIDTTPALQIAQLRKYAEVEERFATIVAPRCGTDPFATRVVAAAVVGAWRTAGQAWIDAGRLGHPIDLLEGAFAALAALSFGSERAAV